MGCFSIIIFYLYYYWAKPKLGLAKQANLAQGIAGLPTAHRSSAHLSISGPSSGLLAYFSPMQARPSMLHPRACLFPPCSVRAQTTITDHVLPWACMVLSQACSQQPVCTKWPAPYGSISYISVISKSPFPESHKQCSRGCPRMFKGFPSTIKSPSSRAMCWQIYLQPKLASAPNRLMTTTPTLQP